MISIIYLSDLIESAPIYFFPALRVPAFAVVDDIKTVGLPNYSADQLINPHLCVCVRACFSVCTAEGQKKENLLLTCCLKDCELFPHFHIFF